MRVDTLQIQAKNSTATGGLGMTAKPDISHSERAKGVKSLFIRKHVAPANEFMADMES